MSGRRFKNGYSQSSSSVRLISGDSYAETDMLFKNCSFYSLDFSISFCFSASFFAYLFAYFFTAISSCFVISFSI